MSEDARAVLTTTVTTIKIESAESNWPHCHEYLMKADGMRLYYKNQLSRNSGAKTVKV